MTQTIEQLTARVRELEEENRSLKTDWFYQKLTRKLAQANERIAELEYEIDSYPRCDVCAIGRRLSALLDDDQWKEIEPMLLGLAKQLAASQLREKSLRETLDAVQQVANRSDGIAGWHLNGDIASWDSILLRYMKPYPNPPTPPP